MATYTGIADANGDFTVPFSSNYTSGQRITVTAEKDSATKSIELYAPSAVTGGGALQFTGSLIDFPNNITGMKISSEIETVIKATCFQITSGVPLFFSKLKTLEIASSITTIEANAFYGWSFCNNLILSDQLITVGDGAFQGWSSAVSVAFPPSLQNLSNYAFYGFSSMLELDLSMTKISYINAFAFALWVNARVVKLPATVTELNGYSFQNLQSCESFSILSPSPPYLSDTALSGLSASCIIKVPASSVNAYKSSWSAFAARIQAI